jgi:drug/metabolite transporter (DMT)-like permease
MVAIVAALLGVLVLNEHFGVSVAAGLALILLGSELGSGGGYSSDSKRLQVIGNSSSCFRICLPGTRR